MRLTRRAFGSLLAAAAAGHSRAARAWGWRSGVNTSNSFSTALTLVNTSGSAVAANFITPFFGHPFKKGDIPAGQYPQFTASGQACPYTMFNKRTWSDGSLKFAGFFMRVPVGISGSGSLSVAISAGVTAPGASSRSTADFTAGGTALQVQVDGKSNLSGTWVSTLGDLTEVLSYTDGDAGRIYRIRASFKQGGTPDGQLECYHYAAALQDSSGGLYGLRHLGRIVQPWYNTAAGTYRSFTAIRLQNGASVLRNCWSGAVATGQTFSWLDNAGGSGKARFTCTGQPYETGFCVQVSNSGGALPLGLSANTDYFAYSYDANTIGFGTDSTAIVELGTAIINSAAGTGTQTVTAYPYVCQYGSLYTCGSAGTWDYVQGAGSVASDATVRVQMNKTYWRSTSLIPSFDLTLSPTGNSTYSYIPNTHGPVNPNTVATGERLDIGVMPAWHVVHFMTQAAADESAVRVSGLACGHFSTVLKSTVTNTFPVVNNNTYSGMPAVQNQFRWDTNTGHTVNATNPTNTFCTLAGWSSQDWSHQPNLAYYPYLWTGEPQYLDMVGERALNAVCHRYSGTGTATAANFGQARVSVVNGTTYYGITFGDSDTLREDAWSMRDLAAMAGICPDSHPESAQYKTYFSDMLTDTFAACVNWKNNLLPAFVVSSGIWHNRQNGGADIYDSWMHGYWTMACAFACGLHEAPANMLAMLNHVVKWPAHINSSFGAFHIPHYECIIRQASAGNSAYVTADSQIAFYNLNCTWSSATGLFTRIDDGDGYTPTLNDQVRWDDNNGAVPTGFSSFTTYYIVNPSGQTFKLAATPSGSAIVLTDNSGGSNPFFVAAAPNNANSIEGAYGPSTYACNQLGAIRYAQAAGATVDAATITALANIVSTHGISYVSDPRYDMTASF